MAMFNSTTKVGIFEEFCTDGGCQVDILVFEEDMLALGLEPTGFDEVEISDGSLHVVDLYPRIGVALHFSDGSIRSASVIPAVLSDKAPPIISREDEITEFLLNRKKENIQLFADSSSEDGESSKKAKSDCSVQQPEQCASSTKSVVSVEVKSEYSENNNTAFSLSSSNTNGKSIHFKTERMQADSPTINNDRDVAVVGSRVSPSTNHAKGLVRLLGRPAMAYLGLKEDYAANRLLRIKLRL